MRLRVIERYLSAVIVREKFRVLCERVIEIAAVILSPIHKKRHTSNFPNGCCTSISRDSGLPSWVYVYECVSRSFLIHALSHPTLTSRYFNRLGIRVALRARYSGFD